MGEFASNYVKNLSGLVAYYKLEDTTDSSGGGNTLTNNNSVTFIPSKFNLGASLGTSNTNKSLSRASNLGIDGGAVTISCWARILTQVPSSSNYALVSLVSIGSTNTSYTIYYFESAGVKYLAYLRLKVGVTNEGPALSKELDLTTFNMFTLTYDATNVRGYFNGILVGGPTAASGNGSASLANQFDIGRTADSLNYASAVVDDTVVLNRAASADEIKDMYNSGLKKRNALKPRPFAPGLAR